MEQRFLSLKQVSVYLGLSSKTLYHWAEEGRIPAYKLGRVWRFDKHQIDDYVKANCANICYNNEPTCDGVERKGG